MNEILLETEDNLKVAVPAKIMLDTQTIERLSTSINTQQRFVEDSSQAIALKTQTVTKVREAIPCGTTRQLTTEKFTVEGSEVDAIFDAQGADDARKEAERKANEAADALLDMVKDNYTCADKSCFLKVSIKKIQLDKVRFIETKPSLDFDAFVKHIAIIEFKGVITLQCVSNRVLV